MSFGDNKYEDENMNDDTQKLSKINEFIINTHEHNLDTKEDITHTFDISRELISKHIAYYRRKIKTKRFISETLRAFIMLFGFLGLLLPILGINFGIKSLFFIENINLTEYGYGFIMIAATLTAIKSFNGATTAHIRSTNTLLKLEKIIVTHTVLWKKTIAQSGTSLDNEEKEKLFEIVSSLLSESYDEILSETNTWEKDLKSSEIDFMKKHIGQVQSIAKDKK